LQFFVAHSALLEKQMRVPAREDIMTLDDFIVYAVLFGSVVLFGGAAVLALAWAVRDGQFRQDLYYRLAIIAIFIPPLRERKEDILPLVEFFIDRYNRRFKKSIRGVTEDTRRLLFSHNWPGNVRELKNTIERGMILEDEPLLRPVYLPFSVGESGGRTVFERSSSADSGQTLPNGRTLPRLYIPEGGTSLEEVEHAMVELAMRQANGNQTHAAKLLDISRDALRYKLKKFGLIRGDEEGVQTGSADEQ